MTITVRGPAWSRPGLDIAESRYPLRVERHVSRLVEALLPGVITTTPHARSYALHSLVWAESKAQQLDEEQAIALMRRSEVVLAGITLRHASHEFPLGQPHGGGLVESSLSEVGVLDVPSLAAPNRYSQNRLGFGGVYLGSEIVLGMVSAGRPPTPGPRVDEASLRRALEPILELAQRDHIESRALATHPALCLCGARAAPDGSWLRQVFLQPPETDGIDPAADRARRDTAQLLARVVANGGIKGSTGTAVAAAFRRRIGFGSFINDDPVARAIEAAHVWRGVILRNYVVGAWRRIWSWMVDQLGEPLPATALADAFADTLPDMRVSQLLDELPPTSMNGVLYGVEEDIRTAQPAPEPLTEVRLLALGARRLSELDGRSLQAFSGSQRADDLGPAWIAAQLQARGDEALRDFARSLAHLLIERAFRVALSKMQLDRNGGFWMPSRIVERAGLLSRRSREGWADVGLRLDIFASVLLGCGVFDIQDDHWLVTDLGTACLA